MQHYAEEFAAPVTRRPPQNPERWARVVPLHRRLIPLMLRQAVRRAGVAP